MAVLYNRLLYKSVLGSMLEDECSEDQEDKRDTGARTRRVISPGGRCSSGEKKEQLQCQRQAFSSPSEEPNLTVSVVTVLPLSASLISNLSVYYLGCHLCCSHFALLTDISAVSVLLISTKVLLQD